MNKYKIKYLNLKFKKQIGGTSTITEQIEQIVSLSSDSTQALAYILSIIMHSLEIGADKYMIMSSYCLHKIRPITDLDVIVTPDAYSKLQQSGLFKEDIAKISKDTRLLIEFPKLGTDASIEIFPKNIDTGFPSDEFSLLALQTTNKLAYDKYSNPYFDPETCVRLYSSVNKRDGKFYASDRYEISESRVRKNIDLLRFIADHDKENPIIRKLCKEKILLLTELLD